MRACMPGWFPLSDYVRRCECGYGFMVKEVGRVDMLPAPGLTIKINGIERVGYVEIERDVKYWCIMCPRYIDIVTNRVEVG